MSLNSPITSTASLILVSFHLLRPMGLTLSGGHSGTLRSTKKGVSEKLIIFTQHDIPRGQTAVRRMTICHGSHTACATGPVI
ncbi:hypothetical protein IFM46972_06844 [Aspergillus udagawae]|uniref:Secreted protein n=1 Tax=Aspergillus udagawae TaxID=91492 RepID=A0A8H3P646_9EURO|nr:hypothetical protein IFM46972_06844 [Aspergillus udagawae]